MTLDRLNLRDVGGHVTSDGAKVATGLAYRSAVLAGLSDVEAAALSELGLRWVYDLRRPEERTELPDELPVGASVVELDVFADAADLAPARLRDLFRDPAATAKLLESDGVAQAMQHAYRRLVNLPSAQASYRTLFSALADDATGPALFHCTAGKDRTGWATAALLLFLGVPRDAVLVDYVAGNAATAAAFQPELDSFAAAGGDPQLLLPFFQVHEPNLDAALGEVTTHYGTIESYFTTALSLAPSTLTALRTRLLR